MTEMQMEVLNWLANGRTGISSETLAFWTAFGIKKDHRSHPHDPSDFNRCLQLLVAVPALREYLPRMKEMSPEWSRLVDRWDEVERTLLEEVGLGWSKGRQLAAAQTYHLMKEIIDEKRRPAARMAAPAEA